MEFFSTFGTWCGGANLWHNGGGFGLQSWMPFHFGGIIHLVLIGLIIYFVARTFRGPNTMPTTSRSPYDTIKHRYAAGEIDKDTFDRMKGDLQ